MCWHRTSTHDRDYSTAGSRFDFDPDPAPRGEYLVSDGERDRVLAALRRHAADGRLAVQEFSERSEAALTSRTADELGTALLGLPQPIRAWQDAEPSHVGRSRRIPLPLLPLIAVLLIATHGWAVLPLVWILFAFVGLRHRHHGGHGDWSRNAGLPVVRHTPPGAAWL